MHAGKPIHLTNSSQSFTTHGAYQVGHLAFREQAMVEKLRVLPEDRFTQTSQILLKQESQKSINGGRIAHLHRFNRWFVDVLPGIPNPKREKWDLPTQAGLPERAETPGKFPIQLIEDPLNRREIAAPSNLPVQQIELPADDREKAEIKLQLGDLHKDQEIGKAVKQAREKMGLTTEELAERIGLKHKSLTAVESGNNSIGPDKVAQIEKMAGMKKGEIEKNRAVELAVKIIHEQTQPVTQTKEVKEDLATRELVSRIKTDLEKITPLQGKMAQLVGISDNRFNNIINCRAVPSDQELRDIARVVGVDVSIYQVMKSRIKNRVRAIGLHRETFGAFFESIMHQQGKSQKQLAKEVGLTECYIINIMRGVSLPSNEVVAKISEALELPDGELELRIAYAKYNNGKINFRTFIANEIILLEQRFGTVNHKLRQLFLSAAISSVRVQSRISLTLAERLVALGIDGKKIRPFIERPKTAIGISRYVPLAVRTQWSLELIEAARSKGYSEYRALAAKLKVHFIITRRWLHEGSAISEKFHQKIEELLGWPRGKIMQTYLDVWEKEVDRRLNI